MTITVILVAVFAIYYRWDNKRSREKRIKAAYTFDKPNIHGTRSLADRKALKKAGLL